MPSKMANGLHVTPPLLKLVTPELVIAADPICFNTLNLVVHCVSAIADEGTLQLATVLPITALHIHLGYSLDR
jgi:hypothetical protein